MNGVSTANLRFRYVAGWDIEGVDPEDGSVACGDGTAYPMEVTGASTAEKIAKIYEIFHRVKDAWFTGGSFAWDWSSNSYSFECPSTGPPVNRAVEVDFPVFSSQIRGYCCSGSNDYNQEPYDAGVGTLYSDISDNENGMWNLVYTSSDYTYTKTAFTYDELAPLPGISGDWWGGLLGGRVMVRFNGKVAVLKADPANGIFDETNKFFIGIEIGFDPSSPDPYIAGGSNIYNPVFWDGLDYGPFSTPLVNYVLRLPSGDLTCQLYCDVEALDNVVASDIVHEAIEWWPYAAGSPAAPIFDTETGEPL